MVVHLFLNNNKALDFLPINSIKNGGITHGAEFGVKSAEEYLSLGRRVIQTGTRIKYSYKGEVRVGYVKFMENSSKGESKFAFVGTNNQGNITTIHVESGKNFWKTINSNTTEKVIYPR